VVVDLVVVGATVVVFKAAVVVTGATLYVVVAFMVVGHSVL